MKYTKFSTLFFASLIACSQPAHGIQIIEGTVAFLAGFTPIVTIGTLVKLRKLKATPVGAINTQSEEFKKAVEKIVADELKKKRDESGTARPTPRPNSGTVKPQLVSGPIAYKSTDTENDNESTKRSVSNHPTNCKCCNRRNETKP